jgi:hypothetical protein
MTAGVPVTARGQAFALRASLALKALASSVMLGVHDLRRLARELGPYLVLTILLPGGLLLAPLLYLHRRRASLTQSRTHDDVLKRAANVTDRHSGRPVDLTIWKESEPHSTQIESLVRGTAETANVAC